MDKLYLLTKAQLNVILENVANKQVLKKIQECVEKNSSKSESDSKKIIVISISKEEVEVLLDELTLLLTSKGLLKNSEPNNFGFIIEDLIDVFYEN